MSYTWQELLAPAGFRKTESKVAASGETCCIWEYDDDPFKLTVCTAGEDGLLLVLSSDEWGKTYSKFQTMTILRHGGNWQDAVTEIKRGYSPHDGEFMQIGKHLHEKRQEDLASLPWSERHAADPALADAVDRKVKDLEVLDQAKRTQRSRAFASDRPSPPPVALVDLLAQANEDPRWAIQDVLPHEGNAFIVASAKTGKTTLIVSLIQSLVDLVPFLGAFDPAPQQGRVGFVNLEVSSQTAKRWFARAGIVHSDAVDVWNLRGESNVFRSQESRAQFANELRARRIETLIVDPFSGAFRGDSMDNDEVKEFLLELDEFRPLAGVRNIVMAVHAGRDTARTRGASTLDDHPDVLWYLSKGPDGTRYFKAVGRDVDVEEQSLVFDSATGHLALSGLSRKVASLARVESELLKVITDVPGINVRALDDRVSAGKEAKAGARRALESKGLVRVESGARGAKCYFIAECPASPTVPSGHGEPVASSTAPPPLGGRTTTGLDSDLDMESHCDECGSALDDVMRISELPFYECWTCHFVNVREELVTAATLSDSRAP